MLRLNQLLSKIEQEGSKRYVHWLCQDLVMRAEKTASF